MAQLFLFSGTSLKYISQQIMFLALLLTVFWHIPYTLPVLLQLEFQPRFGVF